MSEELRDLELGAALRAACGENAAALEGMLAADSQKRYSVVRVEADGALRATIAAADRSGIAAPLQPALIARPADLGPGILLVWSLDGRIQASATPRLRFVLNWLREIGLGKLGGEIGVEVDGGLDAAVSAQLAGQYLAACALDENGWLRLRVVEKRDAALTAGTSLAVRATPHLKLPETPLALLRAVLGPGVDQCVAELEAAGLGTLVGQAGTIYAQALTAVERQCSAELSWRTSRSMGSTALVDCAFQFSEPGLAAYRAALAGDFTGLFAPASHLRLNTAVFTAALGGDKTIELHLPFLKRKSAATRWEALAKSEIRAGGDGRVFAYSVDAADHVSQNNAYQSTLALAGSLLFPEAAERFSITYSDRRTIERRQRAAYAAVLDAYAFPAAAKLWIEAALASGPVEAELALSLPGSLAAAWLRAPGERDPEFFEVYSRVSVAVQRALRKWLPLVYFSDPRRYDDIQAAYPLIFYQSTRPTPGEPRSEFGYDLVSQDNPGPARSWAARPFAAELARLSQALAAEGRKQLAAFYAPRRAGEILSGLVRHPRLVNALLTADQFFIDRLVRLGLKGRELAEMLPRDPRRATRELVRFAGSFTEAFHRRLRRLYGGREFEAFGSLLLVEATQALAGPPSTGDAGMAGTLHLAAAGREQTFVNASYRG